MSYKFPRIDTRSDLERKSGKDIIIALISKAVGWLVRLTGAAIIAYVVLDAISRLGLK